MSLGEGDEGCEALEELAHRCSLPQWAVSGGAVVFTVSSAQSVVVDPSVVKCLVVVLFPGMHELNVVLVMSVWHYFRSCLLCQCSVFLKIHFS